MLHYLCHDLLVNPMQPEIPGTLNECHLGLTSNWIDATNLQMVCAKQTSKLTNTGPWSASLILPSLSCSDGRVTVCRPEGHWFKSQVSKNFLNLFK